MKLLLDTHILLWAAEIVIKRGLGRADFIIDPASLHDGLIRAGYNELTITGKHALFVDFLPPLHKDPFDRILLAQSAYEGITLLTSDELIGQYPGNIICI